MEIINFIKKIQSFVNSTPNKVMFVDENATRRTTYAEFWSLSQKIAVLISQRLQGKERLFVPIYLADSMEYFASELAIWMTGNAAVHMGLSFPKERVDYIMQHCEAEFMIDGKFIEEARQLNEIYTNIRPRTSDQPCAMFYTSGSTGKPKGVLHTDSASMFPVAGLTKTIPLNDYAKFATPTPCYFAAMVITYSMMLAGSELHLLAPEIRRDVHLLEDYIAAQQIELAIISPSLLRIYKNKSKTLKAVIATGERLVGCYSEEYTVLNTFGQTEVAGPVFVKPLDKNYDNTPIGKPIPGVEVVIINEEGHEVPDGEVGELCYTSGIKPPVYYKDPERTAALIAGGVMHSGDLMKRLPNGDILYVQRKDWMVKINGQRVEPGEVETVIRNISGIKDAIVKGFTTDDLTRQYLVGYYILEDGSALDADSIKIELEKKMPSYMVPQYMVKMVAFPLNANNKIDRKSLLPPDLNSMQSEYVAPTNEVEKAVCGIFASVLNLDKVGINDDFALLGGDSIRAMKVQQMYNEKYADYNWGVLSASIINLGHTPKRIAKLLANTVDFVFQEMEDYPLNTGQLLHMLRSIATPTEPVGIIPYAYKLDESIDLDRLAAALEKVTAAHKVFGIRFIEKESGLYRQKYVNAPIRIKPENLDEEKYTQAIKDLCGPIAVLNNPLYSIRVIKAPSGKYLLLSIHHAIYDGTSHAVLMRDISLAYDGKPVPEEKWSQLEVALVEEQFKQSDKYVVANKWFEEKLQDIPMSLPTPDVKGDTPQTATKMFVLQTTANELNATAKKMNATLNVYTTTMFSRLMGKHNGQNKAAVLLPYASRDDYRTQNTVGLLANRFVLNTSWDENTSLKEHLEQTNSYLATAMSGIYSDVKDKKLDCIASLFFQGEMNTPLIGGKEISNMPLPLKSPLSPTPIFVHLFLDYKRNPKGVVLAYVFYYAHMYSESTIKNLMDEFSCMLKEG